MRAVSIFVSTFVRVEPLELRQHLFQLVTSTGRPSLHFRIIHTLQKFPDGSDRDHGIVVCVLKVFSVPEIALSSSEFGECSPQGKLGIDEFDQLPLTLRKQFVVRRLSSAYVILFTLIACRAVLFSHPFQGLGNSCQPLEHVIRSPL